MNQKQKNAVFYAKWLGYTKQLNPVQLSRLSSLIGYFLGNSGSTNPNNNWLKSQAWEILNDNE